MLQSFDITDDGGFILFNDSDNESISKKAPNNFGFMKLSTQAAILILLKKMN